MSKVRFIGDLHLGHESIVKFSSSFRGNVTNVDEHDAWIVEQWNSVVAKNDTVKVLGDVCFDDKKLPLLKKMKGNKHLYLGNHDQASIDKYKEYFSYIHAFHKYKGIWIGHCPIHPDELRGRYQIHGHVHQNIIKDDRYLCVSVEMVGGKPMAFEDIVAQFHARGLEYPIVKKKDYEDM